MPACARNGDSRPSAAITRRHCTVGPPATCTTAPVDDRVTDASAGAKTRPSHASCRRAFRATRRPRASTIHPNGRPLPRRGRNAGQRRGLPPGPPVRDADVEDGAGDEGQLVPNTGILEQRAGAGGDGVGASVEIRVFHGRQGCAVDHRHADAAGCQAARECGANRAGANHADVGFDGLGHSLLPILCASRLASRKRICNPVCLGRDQLRVSQAVSDRGDEPDSPGVGALRSLLQLAKPGSRRGFARRNRQRNERHTSCYSVSQRTMQRSAANRRG